MSTIQRKMTSASVKAIMSKRTTIPQDAIGHKVVLTIQGDGNVIDVKDKEGNIVTSSIPGYEGTVLQKRIFNVKANSALAMSNERTRGFIKAALAAEKAGDEEAAHENFNNYLNSCQISFGVLLPSSVVDKLHNGVDIAAKIELVTTENGSLLTIDPSTISVVEPKVYGTTSFNLDDFMEDEDEESPEEKAARLAAEKKAAKAAKAKA